MSKTPKELAFLRDLYIAPEWTTRFTDIFDENFKFTDERTILYANAGTGNHAIELRRKLKPDAQLTAFDPDAELNNIARAKADIIKAKINFYGELPRRRFDAVLADASLIEPKDLPDFLEDVAGASDRQVVFFLPTAGSFGEIFSFLWEALFALEMHDRAAAVERLITAIPTVARVEEWAAEYGLTNVEPVTKTEFFEFENARTFVESPLAADFLFPAWLDFLDEKEKKPVLEKLVAVIDADEGSLGFRFSIKATLIAGEKN